MNNQKQKLLIVGDNPFHGISHLSQERARKRSGNIVFPVDKAADAVLASLENGADGFSFSVSDHTLSIVKALSQRNVNDPIELFAMLPYAFEYVRVATQTGTPGLAKRFIKQIVLSGKIGAVFGGLWATIRMNPEGLLKTYLTYEISRVKSAAGKRLHLKSVLLNEVIVDMGLALDLDWLFKSFIKKISKEGIKPGFNTRNFPYLINKFEDLGISLDDIYIVTPFNKAGFQMNPSKEECEKTLAKLSSPNVLAISILAAGHFKPDEAADYLAGLKNLAGAIVGVSSEKQSIETFSVLDRELR